jgi:hypothetical protein
VLHWATDKVRQGMQECPLTKAGHRLAPPASCQHGALPLGPFLNAGHATPCFAHSPCLLADNTHAAIPVRLQSIHELLGLKCFGFA